MATMRPASLLADALAPVIDLVFPPRCPACGEALGSQQGLCANCWAGLVIPGEPSCGACQRPFGASGPAHGAICAPCLAHPPRHAGIAAATLYTATSRKLVLAFKHGRRIGLAPMLARMIAARLPAADAERVIVPVPLHRWRLWERGYNQAGLLAEELARGGQGVLLIDALERRRATPSLGGLGAKGRARALKGAIAVNARRKDQLAGREVILVDDVLTSGATADACVKVLRRAGARTVRIACFARVLDEALDARGGKTETPGTEAPGAT